MKRICLIALLIFFVFTSFKEKDLSWVAIGDSITYLNDHSEETGGRVKKGYLTRVVEEWPFIQYTNIGRNGWTSGDIAGNINKLGIIKADVYTVFLGTNDWWAGRPTGKLADYENSSGNVSLYGSFRIIIDKIRTLNPQAKIVLFTPMQRNDFVYIADAKNSAHGSYRKKNNQSLEEFANAILSIGKLEGIAVIDLYHHPLLKIENLVNFKRLKDPKSSRYRNFVYPKSIDVHFDPAKDDYPYPPKAINVTYDGLHPSDKGNAIIAKKVIATFKEIGLAPMWDQLINLKQYMKPFISADTIVDESLQLINDGNLTSGTLLFKANKILSVKSLSQTKVFTEGRDWTYHNDKIKTAPNSKIPVLDIKDLVFTENKPGRSMAGKIPGTFVLFGERSYFSDQQVAVTYIRDKNSKWVGPNADKQKKALPLTISKLSEKKNLSIVFYGNSIEFGHNTSGLEGVAPYMPSWAELTVYHLRNTYGTTVNYVNTSVSGQLAKWGLDSVATRVIPYHPDLVIIGFGMNDGSSNVSPELFCQQIKGMMDEISTVNDQTEFILIAPMLPNPDAIQSGMQGQYKTELLKLQKQGVAIADMTGVHAELLKRKRYQDMTGNNVNHPNDYLARWYAQVIVSLL